MYIIHKVETLFHVIMTGSLKNSLVINIILRVYLYCPMGNYLIELE